MEGSPDHDIMFEASHSGTNKTMVIQKDFDRLVKSLDRWRMFKWIKGKFPDEIDELWVLLRRKKGKLKRSDLTRVSRFALVSFQDDLVAARKFVNRAWLPWNLALWYFVLSTPAAKLRRLREAVSNSLSLVLMQSQETDVIHSYLRSGSVFDVKDEQLYLNRLRQRMLETSHPYLVGSETFQQTSERWKEILDDSFSSFSWSPSPSVSPSPRTPFLPRSMQRSRLG